MKLRIAKKIGWMALTVLTCLGEAQPLMAKITEESIFPNYTGTKVEMSREAVHLRSYPSTDSRIIETMGKEPIYILGSNQDWYRVRSGQEEGWIKKEFISISEEAFIPYSKVIGEEVVDYGKQFIGTPYVWGGNDLRHGVDCSGLTQQLYRDFDIRLSRVSYMQAGDGMQIPKSQLRPGDLVFFDTTGTNSGKISHVGIYVGDGKFLHADCTKGVTISNLSNSYYVKSYVTGSRVIKES